jgi:hypothetical protein
MDEDYKTLLRAQAGMERWAELKYRISNGVCIVCGAESNLKLYVHFCNNCLLGAGVKVEFIDSEEEYKEHPPIQKPVVAIDDVEWLKFVDVIHAPKKRAKKRKVK